MMDNCPVEVIGSLEDVSRDSIIGMRYDVYICTGCGVRQNTAHVGQHDIALFGYAMEQIGWDVDKVQCPDCKDKDTV